MKKSIVGQVVHFTFDNGVEPLEFNCDLLSVNNRAYVVPFGMCHRLGDMAAIPKDESNNFTVTEQMRRDTIQAGIDHYTSSAEWNMLKAQRAAPQNPTILRIAEKRGCTYAEAEAWIAEKMLAEMGE